MALERRNSAQRPDPAGAEGAAARDRRRRQFAPLLYGRKGLDGLGAPAARWLAGNARAAFEFIAEKPKGRHKLRVRRVAAGGKRRCPRARSSRSSTTTCRSWSTRCWASCRRAASPCACCCIRSSRPSATRPATCRPCSAPATRTGATGARRATSPSTSTPLPEADAARSRRARCRPSWTRCAWRWPTGSPCCSGSRRPRASSETAPPSVPAGELREVGRLPALAGGRQLHVPRRARVSRSTGDAETGRPRARRAAAGLGVLRDPDVQVLRRGSRAGGHDAGGPALLLRAGAAHHHQGQRGEPRAPARAHGLRRHQDLSPRRQRSTARSASSGSSPRRPTSARRARSRCCATRSRPCSRLSGYPAASHAGKALLNVLETFPRDELFQIGVERAAGSGARASSTSRRGRACACSPASTASTGSCRCSSMCRATATRPRVRERIGALLAEAYKGRVAAFYPYFPDGPLVRVQFIIGRYEGATPHVDDRASWSAGSPTSCAPGTTGWPTPSRRRATQAEALLAKYGAAFSAGYAETFPAERALRGHRAHRAARAADCPSPSTSIASPARRRAASTPPSIASAAPISLSQRVPVLENLGFSAIDERSYQHHARALPTATREVTLHDMVLETADGAPIELGAHDKRLEACFLAVFRGEADNDSFNRLVVAAGADWRAVAALRAYAAYLRQLGSPFGPRYIADTLTAMPASRATCWSCSTCASIPTAGSTPAQRQAAEAPIRAAHRGRAGRRAEPRRGPHPAPVPQPRRRHGAHQLLPDATRTGGCPATLAFKLDSKAVEAAPQPRPFREIWVYSPRVEGIHLRFAPIARGGIRWSDRAQDFRTEVLGLVRAQLVKNAVIVPSGAKGGFLPKQLPRAGSREEVQKEGVAAYRIFISALLDITDNIKDGKIVPPRARGAPRRRRSLPGGRRRQGHRHLLRHRQRDLGRARLLAGRRLRLRRLGRLRPQGHGDHRARRLGVRQAPLPRDGHRHPAPAVPRGRRRRHVGRRVRQRHAAVASTSSWSRPSTTATSSSTPSPMPPAASPSASACSSCRARAGRTTTRPRSPRAAACSRARPSRSRSATRCRRCSASTPPASRRPS